MRHQTNGTRSRSTSQPSQVAYERALREAGVESDDLDLLRELAEANSEIRESVAQTPPRIFL